jgi:hypothetical protein
MESLSIGGIENVESPDRDALVITFQRDTNIVEDIDRVIPVYDNRGYNGRLTDRGTHKEVIVSRPP